MTTMESKYNLNNITFNFTYTVHEKNVMKVFQDKRFPFYVVYITPMRESKTKVWIYRLYGMGVITWQWEVSPKPKSAEGEKVFFSKLISEFLMMADSVIGAEMDKSTWNSVTFNVVNYNMDTSVVPFLRVIWECVFMRHYRRFGSFIFPLTSEVNIDTKVNARRLNNLRETIRSIPQSLSSFGGELITSPDPIVIPIPYDNISLRRWEKSLISFTLLFGTLENGSPIPNEIQETLKMILKGEVKSTVKKGKIDPI